MLRKLRILFAALCFTAITLLLLDVTGALHAWLGWLAKIQFLPAVMAANLGVIVGILVITLLFGRIYCSVLCPLGVYQDIVNNLSARRKKKKMRHSFSPEKRWWRYPVLGLVILAIIVGIQPFVALLAPYSAWGRIVSNIFQPVVLWINNIIANMSAKAGSYAVYPREVWLRSLPTLIIAAATLIIVTILAWKHGRTWCNTICPVGTFLSLFSRFSMFRPVIDTDKCKSCHICEKKCKSNCIDIANHKIDYSRCVDCFDCLESCKFSAMHYKFAWGKNEMPEQVGHDKGKASTGNPKAATGANGGKADEGRRAFMVGSAMVAGTLAAKAYENNSLVKMITDDGDAVIKTDGGYADVLPKKRVKPETPITPFGSLSVKDFYKRCTACGLCIAECPNNVLRPSTDLNHLMQPEMAFDRGYCRPECTRCSQVCPSGAILPITPEEKTQWKVGTAVIDYDLCVTSKGTQCGNCSRHCPVGAIMMVAKKDEPLTNENGDAILVPSVQDFMCIGCGTCENLCPSRPISAIKVNGLADGHNRNI